MIETEFVIVLTQHRFLGYVFLPYLIGKEDNFYTTIKLIRPPDIHNPDYRFKPYEAELVRLIDKYSDERLTKRFSRAANVSEFFAGLEPSRFQKLVIPFLEQCMWEVTQILMLSPVRLLNKEVKYANLYDEDEIKVLPFFARPVFYFRRLSNETQYQLRIFLNEKEIALQGKKFVIVSNLPGILLFRNQLIVFEKLDAKKLVPFFTKEYVSISRAMEEKYYSGFIRKTIRDFDVVTEGFQLIEGEGEKKAVLSLEYNLKSEPGFVLYFRYGDEQFLSVSGKEVAVSFSGQGERLQFKKVKRNRIWEQAIVNYLHSAGLVAKDGFFMPEAAKPEDKGEALYVIIDWINKHKPELEQADVLIEQKGLKNNYFTGKQYLKIETGTSGDWFDIYASVTFGSYSFPFIKLKNHILNNKREFELPNGEVAIIPGEWFARYKSLMPFAKRRGDTMQLGKHHFTLLQDILSTGEDDILNVYQELTGHYDKTQLPDSLHAELRNYQLTGYSWMYSLHKFGFGGCLADDMGLGKTLQTLALLLKLKSADKGTGNIFSHSGDRQLNLFDVQESGSEPQPASLIVVPTSLVHNWEAEIKKFTPSLKTYKHVGQQRKNGSDLNRAVQFYDIILTTYGTVRKDLEKLSGFTFFYLILDESQYVKNPFSKTYKAITSLNSKYRMALTGTPVENSLSDLWAQMNFLNKGLLGNLAFFRRFFITPVEKHNDAKQKEKLKILIHPFVLRRTKIEVAKDLPPLMEQVIICDMEEGQKVTYEKEKSIIRNAVLAGIGNESRQNPTFIILQGLTRLRQLANHPKLVNDLHETESGKFDEIFRMLENVMAENHKVLLFSSFVKHLVLIRDRIEKENWKYSMLIGSTINRGEIISQFQNDPGNRIFLISLKAGGVGLNLTGADYVFIVDPWWNPAAENQAISRAHRIGQDKHVFVYRFITQGTIEEKIQELQNRKSSLVDKLINSNNPLQQISTEEIRELFK